MVAHEDSSWGVSAAPPETRWATCLFLYIFKTPDPTVLPLIPKLALNVLIRQLCAVLHGHHDADVPLGSQIKLHLDGPYKSDF